MPHPSANVTRDEVRLSMLRDTPYAMLMNKRVYNVLLISTKYDAFMLEDDGRVDEQIFNEYTALNLRYPPRFTQVTSEDEALACLADRNFELVIVMPGSSACDVFSAAGSIKQQYPLIPIVVLTPFSKEVSRRVAREDLSHIDYVFSWLGNSELLVAIIKLIEDKVNAESDMESVGVQTILLVEDSIRFYSSALPQLYKVVLEQSREFSKEALNDHLKMLRMRGRPKIMLARNYEEAVEIIQRYPRNLLGVVSDFSFTRGGVKDPMAGYHLGCMLRQMDPHLPLLLESSEPENARYAEELGAPFIAKRSKSYPQDLRSALMKHFGFGDFVIEDPATHQELFRIKDLKGLQQCIFRIPDDALRHHLSHNHFSRFFYSRAMFPPAEILRMHDVSQYDDMDEARHFIFRLIVEYRRIKNAGVVAVYERDRFDEYSNFARIGNGSLGGKGRGLAFMGTLSRRYPHLATEHLTIGIPRTVVICTDIFDAFMEQNNLYPVALSDSSDEEILQAFMAAHLPDSVLDDLAALFHVIDHPIAVRSSSLLEDSQYQPFAGVYATYMVPRVHDDALMLELLRGAVKAVYASVFYRDSKAYLTATQNLIDQEKMAIVIQEVVGTQHDNLFYPTLSGVARSINFYPIEDEQPEEGVVSMALGLGKYIVDGGNALRFSPAHPRHILQLGSVQTALRDTQRDFLALDLNHLTTEFSCRDDFNLLRRSVQQWPTDNAVASLLLSTYDIESDRLLPGVCTWTRGRRVVTLANLLQGTDIPLAASIKELLHIGEKEMGQPVEIEFAVQIESPTTAHFYLLQVRPIVDVNESVADCYDLQPTDHVLLQSRHVLGNGIVNDVRHVVYVTASHFDSDTNTRIAAELTELNARFNQSETGYVLVGPGRWGSSDPCLGIPVTWPQICAARIVVECQPEGFAVEPSQGSHFFQNLTSLGVGYFTQPAVPEADNLYDRAWLDAQPADYESPLLRCVALSAPLLIRMDGMHQRGYVALASDGESA